MSVVNGLKVLYTNADQFINKKEDLLQFIDGDEPSIILITEVIPKRQIRSIEAPLLHMKGYELYLNFDHTEANLGASGIRGVAIYVKEDLAQSEVNFRTEYSDHIWVEISLENNESILLGCIYRSPSKENNATMRSTLQVCDLLHKAVQRNNKYLLVCGDFNYREIDWENESADEQLEHLSQFIRTFQHCFLYQHVTEPTRYRQGEEPSLLDLVMSNEEGMVSNINYQPGLGDSDHICLTFDLMCCTNRKEKARSQPNYFNADYGKIRNHLKTVNWEDALNGHFKGSYERFMEILMAAMDGNVPNCTHTTRKHNLYMNKDALTLRNKKKKLWKKYVSTRSTSDYESFVRCKNSLRSLTRNLRKKFEKALAFKGKKTMKPFWSYVKSKLKTRTKIPTLVKLDGSLAPTPKEKANALNEYFGNVYQEESGEVPKINSYHDNPVTTINISRDMVMEKLNSLNPAKSKGLDGWHPYFLYSLADILATPLTILYNKSLTEGILPPQWLEACITPIHKKGRKNVVANYRPVSITSVLCKMMESIIRDRIVEYMSSSNLFAKEQHGFVPNRDCMSNLLSAMEDWTEAVELGYDIDVIYTDFAKAFDSVPHKRLLAKLESIGIKGIVLKWIRGFLTGRRHRVSVNGELSDWIMVTSGIPQGSVLGPILFVVFINDMPDAIVKLCKLFADDAKIYTSITSPNDKELLQKDIDALCEWSATWQLPFNIEKCNYMHIGKEKTSHSYVMNQQILKNVVEEKDLGVTIDRSLKFHTHTSAAVKKANSILGLIRKSFVLLDEDTIPLLFKSMVRPHLEYGNVIWGPHFIGDMKAVERVQKRATKMIPKLCNLPYKTRLETLNLPSLEYRRRRGDMIMYFKIITKRLNIDVSDFFTLSNLQTRGHKFKLLKNKPATKQIRCQSFSIRSINDWNALPSHVIEAETVDTFKNRLDEHWKHNKFDSLYS